MSDRQVEGVPGREDQQLLLETVRAARKDNHAFGELYRQTVEQVFRYLYSRTGSRADAEDPTAQTYLAALEAIGNLRREDRFLAWLFSIARSKLHDFYRRIPQPALEPQDDIPFEEDPLADLIRQEETALLSDLICQLPEHEQELLRLRCLGRLPFADIAKLLNKREDAVKKQLYRLLHRLQVQMEVSHE